MEIIINSIQFNDSCIVFLTIDIVIKQTIDGHVLAMSYMQVVKLLK